ncbi:pilus assembly protein CpaB [Granulicella pectinivorans]|jgi:pilus assembly protein CpaB|uniref:Pilus assembly protein CpaB n=1 Tax=Granulicella pectinivorans TaxID=474950 RepID=A0A1I6MRJ7_9BACT|nr:Flp pilus assembly protein CpaB [Granulicella pectinivorans]SFS18306.1 pilus assembly protein CpaB [Granulicella pectinivorans]
MIARRLLLALSLAIVISGLFTYWLSKRFSHSKAAPVAQLNYVSTVHEMKVGDNLKAADLTMIAWPSTTPLQGAFLKQEDVVGRTLLYPIAAHQPVLEHQLSGAGGGNGLSTRIPDGMRALSLKSDQVVGVAGFLFPGTHVDVLVTYHANGSNDPVTATVLQDAPILAAGQKMQPDPDGKANTVDVVTLLVSPQDAEKAVLASTQGTVHFVLRNGEDHEQVNDQPMQISSLGKVAAVKAPERVVAKKVVVAAAAPKPYSIEVLRGDKQTVETF